MDSCLKRLKIPKLLEWLRYGRKLCKRKMPTETHKKLWSRYERVLDGRSRISILMLFMQDAAWYVVGTWRIALSEEYISQEGSAANQEFAKSALPYIKYAMLALMAGRLVLLAASFWKPQLCKLFWLY